MNKIKIEVHLPDRAPLVAALKAIGQAAAQFDGYIQLSTPWDDAIQINLKEQSIKREAQS